MEEDYWVQILTDWVAMADPETPIPWEDASGRTGSEACNHTRAPMARRAWKWLVDEGHIAREVLMPGQHAITVWRLT